MSDAKTENQATIVLDRDTELVFLCAIRYCYGRRTYMPSLIMEKTRPLLPVFSDAGIRNLYDDLKMQYEGQWGDPIIDKPTWMNFVKIVEEEYHKRFPESGGCHVQI